MNYLMIETYVPKKQTVHRYSNSKMAELFSPEQIKMLRDGKRIICNSHHGNDWVVGANATVCDMAVITKKFMGP